MCHSLIPKRRMPATIAILASRSENGYNVIGWTKAGMTYWTVSDLNKSELDQFAKLYQK